ncbi:MAG TPA: EAL domain-containing protein [Xanthobacteraceae bacterium]
MRLLYSIRSRLLGLALAAVLPLAALMAAALWIQWQSDRDAATEHAINEARLLAVQVDDHISDMESLLSALGQAVSYDPADRQENDVLLQKVKRELPNIDSHILLFDLEGNNIGTSQDPDYPRPNAHDRVYFREALADHRPAVGEPILVRSGRHILNVAHPVKDTTGRIRAVITVGPVLDHFQDILKVHGLPVGSIISIVNTRGVFIAGSPVAQDPIGRHGKHLPLRIAAQEGSDVSHWTRLDNVERVNGFSMAHRVPWLVTVGVPTDIAYAALASRLKWGALASVGTLVLALTIAWLFSGRIVRPLRQLGKDAAVLARGDLSHRTAVSTPDEVGALADTFNQMAQALDDDLADRKAAEEQLRKLAHYDQLTGLPNRTMLQQELRRLLTKDGGRTPISVVLFDLDEFKDVNDTLGHSTGDQLLAEVGRRLLGVAEERAMVGLASRLGGDEFVVMLPDCGDPRAVSEIVDLMLKRLNEPFFINEQLVHLGASAGVAIAPQDGADVEELIANADLALYQAKSAGGRNLRFFTPVLRAQAQARRHLGLELRRAFVGSEFEIHFQPQIRLADNAVVGAEALLRWRHPQRGVLAPGAFIDTLAESANAVAVGRWIIRAACKQAAAWRAAGLPLGRVGVNLFPQQANAEALADDVMAALADFGLPAAALELEITENIALNRDDSAVLQRLHDAGVKLALDDFGTGYASLAYLTRLPLSRIKIDRGFIGNVTRDAQDAAIVRSLIAMAHNLDIGVIAEGVETSQQADFLRNEKCEEAQGFLYARPLPAEEFEAYLRTRQLASAVTDEHGPQGSPSAPFGRPPAKSPGRRRSSGR